MKTPLFVTLITVSVVLFTGCDPDFWTGGGEIYDREELEELLGPEGESGPTVSVSYKSKYSYTVNGLNFSYCIDNVALKVGDTLKVTIDSENEVKPWAKLLINGDEKLFTSDLPIEYSDIIATAGVYEIVFEIYNSCGEYQFKLKTGVTVN